MTLVGVSENFHRPPFDFLSGENDSYGRVTITEEVATEILTKFIKEIESGDSKACLLLSFRHVTSNISKKVLEALKELANDVKNNTNFPVWAKFLQEASQDEAFNFDFRHFMGLSIESFYTYYPRSKNMFISSWLEVPWIYAETLIWSLLFFIYTRDFALSSPASPSLAGSLYPSFDIYNQLDPTMSSKMEAATKGLVVMHSTCTVFDFIIQDNFSQSSDEELFQQFETLCHFSLVSNKFDLSTKACDNTKILSDSETYLKDILSHANEMLVKNTIPQLWTYVCSLKTDATTKTQGSNNTIDVIMDNSSVEWFSDVCLADWLLRYGACSKVIFHVKATPLFVSDVTESFFHKLIEVLQNNPAKNEDLITLSQRWNKYLQSGQFEIKADTFWCLPSSYWAISELAPDLAAHLARSSLVIWKGDLNYRKLGSDCVMPKDTSYQKGFGSSIVCPHYLIIRVIKSNIAISLDLAKVEEVSQKDPNWTDNCNYGIIDYLPANQMIQ